MSDPFLDTASQRPATGLDQGARGVILRVVAEICEAGPVELLGGLFRDRYGGASDYYSALEQVCGSTPRYACERAATDAELNAGRCPA